MRELLWHGALEHDWKNLQLFPSGYVAPSWSWASYQGMVFFPFQQSDTWVQPEDWLYSNALICISRKYMSPHPRSQSQQSFDGRGSHRLPIIHISSFTLLI
jgi:hypothetical protein